MVYLLTFVIMALVVAGMAVGVMAGRGPLKGSCGGLAAVGIGGECEICGGDPQRCDEEQERTRLQASEASYYDAAAAARDPRAGPEQGRA
jgi:hypothetical protein